MEVLERTVNGRSVKIYIGSGLEMEINRAMEKYSGNITFVSSTLRSMYSKKISAINSIKSFMKDGERAKSMVSLNAVFRKLIKMEAERDSSISYIGGGTLGDLTGYAASVYKRGVHYLGIPTTLLAQVDSSIGGKNAINFMNIKNAIGTFYNPEATFSDTDFLLNSDPALLRDGISEAIKMALIMDSHLFKYFTENDIKSIYSAKNLEYIIKKSAEIKLNVVSADFFDSQKIRYLLNFGHSIGHALESYSENTISHGTAVANGMIMESYIAYKAGYSSMLHEEILNAITRYGIPLINFRDIETDKLISYMRNDKKVEHGKLNMVMLNEYGSASIREIEFQKLRRYINLYRDGT
ncbi:3-dehydroquinate synthase [Ferroplasma sp.]|uniref:3-dehydroquinate synthase n=1 Tax=Ferroplasma sp. TaxID=2591003 RepID=UPI00263964A7|nr:3-dehydroquinate synthase [Ferroplasma sp.]MCL4453785.1 3-dehydroquinate synthase [Candidatus Thermoplasmatota archaeon]